MEFHVATAPFHYTAIIRSEPHCLPLCLFSVYIEFIACEALRGIKGALLISCDRGEMKTIQEFTAQDAQIINEEPVPGNGRKRLCIDEDEDGYANKLCNGEQEEEEEEGQKVVDDKNENQENNNGDEDKKEDDENNEAEEGKEDGIEEEDRKTEELDEGEQEEPGGNQDGNRERKEDAYCWIKMTMMKKNIDRMLD
ncbi:acidic leucine-rich nuclear phosphoprotein 32 family member B-like [Capsicum annuum]|uniref:acidic leucine-rich nuclear phosphoprotein 32 family member B-like n=1 Tax=Capsicum annuum TaxID=4072 RepID=UPI001FB11911|nr:acidic leucine-rich nuclear phosphoprotein 32 family member B-like [Capsicum annuum]